MAERHQREIVDLTGLQRRRPKCSGVLGALLGDPEPACGATFALAGCRVAVVIYQSTSWRRRAQVRRSAGHADGVVARGDRIQPTPGRLG